MATYTDDFNRRLTLEAGGRSGGEGTVHDIVGMPDKIAKIYHDHKLTNAELTEKLGVMIANPPHDPMKAHGHMSLAWPESRLFENGRFAGYLMPKVTQAQEILEFYNPIIRSKKHPGVTWKNLHAIARNLAAALAAIHTRDYVVGDLNEGNILVNDQSLVTLIDTDSFQVRDPLTGRLFRCQVGKGEFTPAELQRVNLDKADRFAYHDLFGLGVLIFQVLMEGFHPFTGVDKAQAAQSGSTVFQRNIGQGHFPYDPAGAFVPPPAAPAFDNLDPDLRALFLRCFVDGHRTPADRPTAQEWHRGLQAAESALRPCPVKPQHWHSPHLLECPWCKREKTLAALAATAGGVAGGSPLQTPSPQTPTSQTSTPQTSTPQTSTSQTPPVYPPPPSRGGAWRALLALLLIGALSFAAWQMIGDRIVSGSIAGNQPAQLVAQSPSVRPSPTTGEPAAAPPAGVPANTNAVAAGAAARPTSPPPTNPPPTMRPTNPPPATDTPEPGCEPAPSPRWANTLWAAHEAQLGCPTTQEMRPSDFAFQYFENATAIWREDLDRIYFLYHDGTFSVHRDDEGPEGYEVSPLVKNGFGYMWNTYPALRERLGEPVTIEANPADFAVQDFAGGVLIYFNDNGPYEFALFNENGTWVGG